jgi:hypothetical protein
MIGSVEMMQTARPVAAAALTAAALAASGAQAQEAASPPGFRLFPGSAAEAPPPPSARGPSASPAEKRGKDRRFWLATGELLGLEVVSWGFNRYAANWDYARISWETVHDNLRAGFTFDNDKFLTNQLGHAFGGSYYFNAPRSNGFTFLESALFTAAGSAIWEITAESQGPSLNDLVNTTLGGAVFGEACYRLSQMILDDRVRGGARVAREALAGLINPAQLLTRAFTGDLRRVRAERGETIEPSRVAAELDGGWRHFASSRRADPDQAFLAVTLRYGDPFDRAFSRPFDSFDLGLDVSWPSTAWLTRVEVRGLLGGWDLDAGSAGARHVIGLFMDFDYTNDDTRVLSSQSFRFGLLSKRSLGKDAELRAEALGAAVPLAALKNEHLEESSGLVGRSYDYGPGAAIYTSVRVRRRELDLATLAYSVFWMHTSNGIARNSSIETFRAEGRIPLAGSLSVGASWSWEKRISTYDEFETFRSVETPWRAFASWMFR